MTDQIPSRVLKTFLQAAQKDLRGEAREKSTSGGVLNQYVGARRLSATTDCVKTPKLLRRWKKDTIFMSNLTISSLKPFRSCFKVGQHERHSGPSLTFHTV